jgi:hypothetical protein
LKLACSSNIFFDFSTDVKHKFITNTGTRASVNATPTQSNHHTLSTITIGIKQGLAVNKIYFLGIFLFTKISMMCEMPQLEA